MFFVIVQGLHRFGKKLSVMLLKTFDMKVSFRTNSCVEVQYDSQAL